MEEEEEEKEEEEAAVCCTFCNNSVISGTVMLPLGSINSVVLLCVTIEVQVRSVDPVRTVQDDTQLVGCVPVPVPVVRKSLDIFVYTVSPSYPLPMN